MGMMNFNQDYAWLKSSFFFRSFEDGFFNEFSRFLVNHGGKLTPARRVELLKNLNSVDLWKLYLKNCSYSFRGDVRYVHNSEERSKRLMDMASNYLASGRRACRSGFDEFVSIFDLENCKVV